MLSLENSDDIFLVTPHFYDFIAFHISQIIPLSCSLTAHFRPKNFLTTLFVCTIYTPCIHPHAVFSTLLRALVTVNTAHTIYFFLIHHCTNSISSLHIFVHHRTFCASLHTKTSPAFYHLGQWSLTRGSTELSK